MYVGTHVSVHASQERALEAIRCEVRTIESGATTIGIGASGAATFLTMDLEAAQALLESLDSAIATAQERLLRLV